MIGNTKKKILAPAFSSDLAFLKILRVRKNNILEKMTNEADLK